MSPVCFSHLQQLPPECRLPAALVWLSVLLRGFWCGATATRSHSCCVRSGITGAFGFCQVWTEGKVAAAALCSQVCRSEMGWQAPAPPTWEVPSCVCIQRHWKLLCPASSPAPWDVGLNWRCCRCPGTAQSHRVLPQAGAVAAASGAPGAADVRASKLSGLTMTMSEHAGDSAERWVAAHSFEFALEAVPILLLEAGGNLQPTGAWLISLLKCWAPSTLKYFCPIAYRDRWWFGAFMWGVCFVQVLSPWLGSYILWQVSLEYEKKCAACVSAAAVGSTVLLIVIPEEMPSNYCILFLLCASTVVLFFVIFLFQRNILKRFICIEWGNSPSWQETNKQKIQVKC